MEVNNIEANLNEGTPIPSIYGQVIADAILDWERVGYEDDFWSEHLAPGGVGFVDVQIFIEHDTPETEDYWRANVFPVVPSLINPSHSSTDTGVVLHSISLGFDPNRAENNREADGVFS